MNALRERVATPPFILGNWPRIEIVFECVATGATPAALESDDSKYKKLGMLKELLDSGALTRDEFEKEKAKLLGQP